MAEVFEPGTGKLLNYRGHNARGENVETAIENAFEECIICGLIREGIELVIGYNPLLKETMRKVNLEKIKQSVGIKGKVVCRAVRDVPYDLELKEGEVWFVNWRAPFERALLYIIWGVQ